MLMNPGFFSCLSTGLIAAIAVSAGLAQGQDYPNKVIRVITGTAGGGTDFSARTIVKFMSGPLGQPVIIDNRPALVGADAVSKAPPDGYTLFISGSSFLILPFLQSVSYSPSDFAPISLLARELRVLAVHPSLPVKSVKELIALAKAKPGALNYASTGIGSTTHLTGELFKSMAGINMVHIPYKTWNDEIADLISGQVHVVISDWALLSPHAKQGKLRILAAASAEPSALVPGLPTVSASGLPGFSSVAMTGLFAPAKTPEAIIRRLNQEAVRSVNTPDVKQTFFNMASEVVGSSSEQFAATVKSEVAMWAKVIKNAGLSPK